MGYEFCGHAAHKTGKAVAGGVTSSRMTSIN
jgi:hypothetical protein